MTGYGNSPEEGDNGVSPWGPRPGNAMKAKWIFKTMVIKER